MKSAHQPFCQPPPHAGRTHPGFPWHSGADLRSRCQAALSGSHHAPSGDGQAACAVVVHRGGFRAGRNHLNCGIAGTFMRGGGIGATFLAFPIPLGSTNILFNAPNAAAFGRPLLNVPLRLSLHLAQMKRQGRPRPRRMRKRLLPRCSTWGKLHYDSLERRMFRGRLCT